MQQEKHKKLINAKSGTADAARLAQKVRFDEFYTPQDDIKNELFSYSFDVLDDIYHGLFVMSEEQPEIDETKQPLYEQLMSAKKNQKLALYFEGKEKQEYRFISRFIFEDELFFILKDNSGEKVYRYTYRDEKEKIAPIKDDNLLRFLKQLNED